MPFKVVYLSLQWGCVPFVLMNPHTLDIRQTLMNNTLHGPWIGTLELKKTFIFIDDFLYLVRMQQYGLSDIYDNSIARIHIAALTLCGCHASA